MLTSCYTQHAESKNGSPDSTSATLFQVLYVYVYVLQRK